MKSCPFRNRVTVPLLGETDQGSNAAPLAPAVSVEGRPDRCLEAAWRQEGSHLAAIRMHRPSEDRETAATIAAWHFAASGEIALSCGSRTRNWQLVRRIQETPHADLLDPNRAIPSTKTRCARWDILSVGRDASRAPEGLLVVGDGLMAESRSSQLGRSVSPGPSARVFRAPCANHWFRRAPPRSYGPWTIDAPFAPAAIILRLSNWLAISWDTDARASLRRSSGHLAIAQSTMVGRNLAEVEHTCARLHHHSRRGRGRRRHRILAAGQGRAHVDAVRINSTFGMGERWRGRRYWKRQPEEAGSDSAGQRG